MKPCPKPSADARQCLLAGTATVDLTPPVGTPLAGFAARDHGSEGIHDPLHAKALVLDDGSTRLCLL
ncbi:MAG: hypothetical protein WCP21_10655, partial [Armatimonadota bacterium]